MKQRVLICDDQVENYKRLSDYFRGEGFEVHPRLSSEEEVRDALDRANDERRFFQFVLLDIELGHGVNGIDLYRQLSLEYPNEAFIIYSSADVESFRSQLSHLSYRDVEVVLLDEILRQDLHVHFSRAIRRPGDPEAVFFVHGRHRAKNRKIRTFLRDALGLRIVEFEDARERVKTRDFIFEIVLAGIEASQATVVLFTDEERVELSRSFRRAGELVKRRQARPNVYIEAGYAFGVRPRRTVLVEWPASWRGYESPSDLGGIHTVRFKDTFEGRKLLRRRLEAARCRLTLDPKWHSIPL